MILPAAFAEHAAVVNACAERLGGPLAEAITLVRQCLGGGHKVLACGNGGSAAAAQHFIAELVCRFHAERGALTGVALTADSAILTAIGNDYGYERVFARQVEALGTPGDMLMALSTSGNSPNVIAAARAARERCCKVLVLTGADGGALAPLADVALCVPSTTVARIQEVHDLCIHVLAEALEPKAARGTTP